MAAFLLIFFLGIFGAAVNGQSWNTGQCDLIVDNNLCKEDGEYPHPSDCEKYYVCNRSGKQMYSYTFTCPDTPDISYYNASLKNCVVGDCPDPPGRTKRSLRYPNQRNRYSPNRFNRPNNRIVGGVVLAPEKQQTQVQNVRRFPYQVIIKSTAQGVTGQCSGVILHPRVILTSNQCRVRLGTYAAGDVEIIAGTNSLRQTGNRQRVLGATAVTTPVGTNAELALIELPSADALQFNQYVNNLNWKQPAQNGMTQTPTGNVLVAGWGSTDPASPNTYSNNLAQACLPIRSDCSTLLTANYNSATQSCAGFTYGDDIYTCVGDGGAPVLCYDSNSKSPFLCGIVADDGICNWLKLTVFTNVATTDVSNGIQTQIDNLPA